MATKWPRGGRQNFLPSGTKVKTTKSISWHGLRIPRGVTGRIVRMLEGGDAARVSFDSDQGTYEFDLWVQEFRPTR